VAETSRLDPVLTPIKKAKVDLQNCILHSGIVQILSRLLGRARTALTPLTSTLKLLMVAGRRDSDHRPCLQIPRMGRPKRKIY
jgi:hypothetical protein